MRLSKKKKEVEVVEPIEKLEVIKLSFEEFYYRAQTIMEANKPCHPDWYMLGASSSQYPLFF